jgi:predicted nucleic acid-binding protein
MRDKYFLDTNIFVYMFTTGEQAKSKIAKKLIEDGIVSNSGVVSSQVVQEFLNVLLKKHVALHEADLQRLLNELLLPICDHYPDAGFYRRVLETRERYQLGLYNAMIVAAANDMGCKTLYSEDLQHQQTYGIVQVINPFV